MRTSLGIHLGQRLRASGPTNTTGIIGGGLRVPGTTGTRAETPHSTAFDLSDEIDVDVDVDLIDYTLAGNQTLITLDGSWRFGVRSSGAPVLTLFGKADIIGNAVVPFADGEGGFLRVQRDRIAGTTIFLSSSDGASWTTFATAPTNTLTANTTTNKLMVGGRVSGESADGLFRSARVRDGIDGALVASPDFDAQPHGTTSFTDAQGRVWSVLTTEGA